MIIKHDLSKLLLDQMRVSGEHVQPYAKAEVQAFWADLRDRESLMVVLERDTIADAWHMMTEVLKNSAFHGRLYAYFFDYEEKDEKLVREQAPQCPKDLQEEYIYWLGEEHGGIPARYLWGEPPEEFLATMGFVFAFHASQALAEELGGWPAPVMVFAPGGSDSLLESYVQVPYQDSDGGNRQNIQVYPSQVYALPHLTGVPFFSFAEDGEPQAIDEVTLGKYAEQGPAQQAAVAHIQCLSRARELFAPPPVVSPMLLCPMMCATQQDIEEMYAYLLLLARLAAEKDKGAIVPIFARGQTADYVACFAEKIWDTTALLEDDEIYEQGFYRHGLFQAALSHWFGEQDEAVRERLCYTCREDIEVDLANGDIDAGKVYFYIADAFGEEICWPESFVKHLIYRDATLSMPREREWAAASSRAILPSSALLGVGKLEAPAIAEGGEETLALYEHVRKIAQIDGFGWEGGAEEDAASIGMVGAWLDAAYTWICQATDPKSDVARFFAARRVALTSINGNALECLFLVYRDFIEYLREVQDCYPDAEAEFVQGGKAAPANDDARWEGLHRALVASVCATGAIDFSKHPQLASVANLLTRVTGSAVVSVPSAEAVRCVRAGEERAIGGIEIEGGAFRFADLPFAGVFTIDGGEMCNAMIYARAEGMFAPPGLPWLSMKDVGLELYAPAGGLPSLEITGVLSEADLFLRVGMDWGSGICAMRGGFAEVVTALDAISALTGGVDFAGQLPPQLRELGGLGLRGFTAEYDMKNSKVRRFALEFTVERAWVVLEKPLLTVHPTILLDIYNPADFALRSFHTTIWGDCTIGEGNGVLRLSGSYPPLGLGLELLAGQEFSVKTLLEDCGIQGFAYDLVIDTLRVRVAPASGHYHFEISVRDVLDLGKFSIDSLGLYLTQSRAGFSAAFAGSMTVCGVRAYARVAYATRDGWALRAGVSLGKTGVTARDLIAEYGGNRVAPMNGDEPNPPMARADVSYAVRSGYWKVAAAVEHWQVAFLTDVDLSAAFAIGEDATGFFCALSGECVWHNIDIALGYSYKAGANCFTLRWNKFEGRVFLSETQRYAELSLSGTTLGEMVETMVGWVCGAEFGLGEPWGSLLNSIPLHCALRYDFLRGVVSLTVRIPALDVGFARVDGVTLTYGLGEDGKRGAFISLSGSFPWMTGNAAPAWDASRPETTPAPGGKGNAYFDLRLLAMGQKVDLFDGKVPGTVEDAVGLLRKLDPDLWPPRSDLADWVIAADFGLLRQGDGAYLLDAQLLFYDPLLYALRISAGAGIFRGLVFDILYAKIDDNLGVFRGVITLPPWIRRIDLGAYTLILPIFSVDIYTDGSFRIDFGFPAGGDFSRSLSFQGMAGPIPITGSAGLYIGRLSGAAAGDLVPKTNRGIFNPVTAFGFGLKFGIGKSINAGVLKAGFSLTMMAILEGVFAKFSPYAGDEEEDYYRVTGMIGVEGGLYGMIDFAIISASISASISLTATFRFEAYRAFDVQVNAAISVTASLKINLWLFSITISFHFSANVSASFTIGENRLAPWDDRSRLLPAPLESVRAAALNFHQLAVTGPPFACTAQIAPALSVTDRPAGQITAALLLTIEPAGFAELTRRLMVWLMAAAGTEFTIPEKVLAHCPTQAEIDAILAALEREDALPFEELDLFLLRFMKLKVPSQKALRAANVDLAGVFFPLPPTLLLDYHPLSEAGSLSAATLDAMKAAFGKLALQMKEEEGLKSFRRPNGEKSAAEWLFGDYFVFLARQALERARPFADGQTPLSRILEGLDYAGIGGMISRYNLHGLRVPLPDGTERPAFALAGTLRGGIAKNWRVQVTSPSSFWLSTPSTCYLAPDPTGYDLLDGFLKGGQLTPSYEVLPTPPASAPVTLSFPSPYTLGDWQVWHIPAALPRGGERYALRFDRDPAGESRAACVLPLVLQKTRARGVYTICGSTEESARALADVVRRGHPIRAAHLFIEQEGTYSAVEAKRIVAARMDLSTETHPPLQGLQGAEADYAHLATLLFEALATNNNGYVLIVPADLPDDAFDARGRADFRLLLLFAPSVEITEEAVSAVVARSPCGTPVAVAERSRYRFAATSGSASAVNAEFAIRRVFPEGTSAQAFVENNYSLLRYAVRAGDGFRGSDYGAPVSFTEDGLFRFALPADTLLGGEAYAAVGHTLTLDCQWLDVFGNLYGQGFSLSVLCGYQDALVPPSAWPYLRLFFDVEGQNVVLRGVPADRGSIPAGGLDNVRAEYAHILGQLRDPGGVDTLFECPSLGVLGNAPLAAWAEKTAAYLEGIGDKPELACPFPIRRRAANARELELRPIRASVRVERRGKVQKGFEDVPHVTSVRADIPAPGDVRAFAAAYEAAIGGVRVLRHGEELLESPDIAPEIRLGKATAYAAPPFWQTPYSGSADAYSYTPGKGLAPTAVEYVGADGNRMAADALGMIDGMFSADIMATAALCGYPAERAESAKKGIAKALAGRLLPVSGATAPPDGAVREAFYQRLLSTLTSYYSLRGMIALDATVGVSRENARLYGVIRGETEALGLDFGSAKLDLRAGAGRLIVGVTGQETVYDRRGAALARAEIALRYDVTHVEDQVEEVTGGYVSSAWLGGASRGGLATLSAPESVLLPLPALYFPEVPVFTAQKFVMDEDFTARYCLSYAKSRHLPQVEDHLTVLYNPGNLLRGGTHPLMNALAGFANAGEDILRDLRAIAEKALAEAPEVEAYAAGFAVAMDAMLALCAALERALPAAPSIRLAREAGEAVRFRVSEGALDGRYTLTVDGDDILPILVDCVAERVADHTYTFRKEGEYVSPAQGQAIRERSFLLPPRKILAAWAATAEIYARVNATLSEAFVMKTDTVAAGGVARADFAVEEAIDLHARYGEEEAGAAIAAFLTDVGGTLPISAECRRVDSGGAEFPLFMQLPTRDAPAALAAAWMGKIRAWLATVPEPIRRDASFAFRLDLRFGDVLKIPRALVRV